MDPKTGEISNPDDLRPENDQETPKKPDIPLKNPRDIAIEEMAKRSNARREKEEKRMKADILEEDGTITPVSSEPEPDVPRETPEPVKAAEAPPSTEAKLPSAPPAAPEEERELIVDGKRIRVPISKILDAGTRTLQKESAADMRLAAATELLRSAQERQQTVQTAPVAQQQPSDDDAALARSIQFGTEEEAKSAIAKIRNATPAITPQQIDAYVQQQLAQKLPDHNAFHSANAWLRTEYPQITADPDLKLLFDTNEQKARQLGDRRPYAELYADLAGQMATKFSLKKVDKQEPSQPMTTQASDRLVRKATGPRPVTGASGRTEQATQPKKAPTVAEYVQRQRELRGLQPFEKQGI